MLKLPKKTLRELSDESLNYGDLSIENECVGMPKVIQDVDAKTGRVVNRVVFEVTPPEKMNAGLHVEDFALENLIAAGVDVANPQKRLLMSSSAPVSEAGCVLESLKEIDDYVESSKNVKEIDDYVESSKNVESSKTN